MKPPVFDSTWREEVVRLYEHDVQEMWDPTIAPHVWNQYHDLLDLYLELTGPEAPLDIIDVGCAQGTLALLLAERGHRVWALDIRPWFLDYARSRHTHGDLHFVCANALEYEPQRRFDVVHAHQVLEHLVFPGEMLARMRGWLRPGGTLIASTPNGRYLRSSLPTFSELGDAADHAHRQFTADGDGHFFFYTAEELLQLVSSAGFESAELRCVETPWISGHMKIRYLHRVLPSGLLRRLDRVSRRIPWLGEKLCHQIVLTARSPAT